MEPIRIALSVHQMGFAFKNQAPHISLIFQSMKVSGYKYDIAFSFLHTDERIATQLYDKINEKFKAFLFTKKQEEIVGTDGMDSYSNVFLNEARLNVVLYREGWGDTRWTKIEKNAIKTRIFNEEKGEGWDSLLIIKLDKSKLPSWVVDYYVYLDYETYGFDGIIGAITFKSQSLGANITEETIMSFAERQQRQIQLNKNRESYLESITAVNDANIEIEKLFSEVSEKWKVIKESMPELQIGGLKTQPRQFIQFSCKIYFLVFTWNHRTINSLYDSFLEARIYTEPRFSEHRYHEVASTKYKFTVNEIMKFAWLDNDEKIFLTSALIDHWIKTVISLAHEHPKKGNGDEIIDYW